MSQTLQQTNSITQITQNQLVTLLNSRKGAQIISIVVEIDPGKNQKCKNKVIKRSYINGIINWHYGNAVNRQLKREGSNEVFQASIRKWGKRISNSPFVEHNGQLYLEMKVQNVYQTQYLVYQNGKVVEVPRISISQFIRDKSTLNNNSPTQKPIVLCDYKLSGIRQVKMNGRTYNIT